MASRAFKTVQVVGLSEMVTQARASGDHDAREYAERGLELTFKTPAPAAVIAWPADVVVASPRYAGNASTPKKAPEARVVAIQDVQLPRPYYG